MKLKILTMETTLQPLIQTLQESFNWNLARAKCTAYLIVGFIQVRSINLVQLAITIPGDSKKESKYRRIQRLFKELCIDMKMVATFIKNQLPDGKFILAMDRTNWKFGKTHINILFLAICYNGFTLPVLWETLPQDKKCGNSDTQQRIALIKRFIAIFGIERIECILADREFIGKDWFKYLIDNNIKFRIRIKYNTQISRAGCGLGTVKNFFRQLRVGEAIQLNGVRKVFGINLYITGMKLLSGKLLIVVSSDSAPCDQILNDYKKRWGIECLFKALKSQGFDFETTHLTDPQKIDKLIALMAIACVWVCKTGQWLNDKNEIPIKDHGRKSISVFRYGLDYLREIFLNVSKNFSQLQVVLGFIQKGSIPINSNVRG